MKTKNVVITGGSDGVGRALVLEMGQRGHDVLTIGRSESKVDALGEEFARVTKSKLVALVGDMTVAGDFEKFVLVAADNFSQVDVLVNNAGFHIGNALLEDADEEKIKQMFEIHALVPLRLYKQFYPGMKTVGAGMIVNVVSVVVRNYLKETCGPYTVTKFAQYGLSNMMIKEASKNNVRVTNVILGGTDTNIREGERPEYLLPADVAEVVGGIVDGPESVFVSEIHMHPKVHLA